MNGPRAEGKIDIYIFLHVLFEVPLPVPNLPPGGTSVHFSFPSWPAAKSLQLCPTLCDPINGSP